MESNDTRLGIFNIHQQSEVYQTLMNLSPEEILSLQDEFTNQYKNDKFEFYLYLVDRLNLRTRIDSVIDLRLKAFFLFQNKNIIHYDSLNIDKLKLLIAGEKFALAPNDFVGTPWELFKNMIFEKFNYNSGYVRDLHGRIKQQLENALQRRKEMMPHAELPGQIVKEKYIDKLKRTGVINPSPYTITEKEWSGYKIERKKRFLHPLSKVTTLPCPVMLNLEFEMWKKLFTHSPMANEVEVRFLNVTGSEFGNLFEYLMFNENFFFHNTQSEVRSSDRSNDMLTYRKIIYGTERRAHEIPRYQSKKKLTSLPPFNHHWQKEWGLFHVADAEEKELKYVSHQLSHVRKKNTFKFYTPIEQSDFHNLEISLSIVIDAQDPFRRKYEIELERINKIFNHKVYKVERAVKTMIEKMYNKISPDETPVSASSREAVIAWLSTLPNLKTTEYRKIAQQVIPLTKHDIVSFVKKEIYISPKVDGQRFLFAMLPHEGSFLLGMNRSIKRIGYRFNETSKTSALFDCEVVRTNDSLTIYIFDILFYQMNDLRSETFSDRHLQLKGVIQNSNLESFMFSNIKILFKPFHKMSNKDNSELLKWIQFIMTTPGYDGLILQQNDSYNNAVIFKWKPLYMNTVDLAIPFNLKKQNTVGKNVLIIPHHSKGPVDKSFVKPEIPKGTEHLAIDMSKIPFGYNKNFDISNFIVECFYNKITGFLTPTKIRFDKPNPNGDNVVISTLGAIADPLTLNEFRGKGLVFARKILSEAKRTMLKKHTIRGKVLLDIGSGQGGTLGMWKRQEFSKIIAFEGNKEMIDRFNSRLNSYPQDFKNKIVLKGEYFDANSLMSLSEYRFDYVTFFMSVNYICQSEKSIIQTIRTLNNLSYNTSLTILILFQDDEYIKKHILNNSQFAEFFTVFNVNSEFDSIKVKTNIPGSYVLDVEEYLFRTERFISLANPYFDIELDKSLFDNVWFSNMSQADQIWLKSHKFLKLTKPKRTMTATFELPEFIYENEDMEQDVNELLTVEEEEKEIDDYQEIDERGDSPDVLEIINDSPENVLVLNVDEQETHSSSPIFSHAHEDTMIIQLPDDMQQLSTSYETFEFNDVLKLKIEEVEIDT